MTSTTTDPTPRILGNDPLLRWEAIAAHARDHHGTTWPDDDAAVTAIVGAFDAIVPLGCDYDPDSGTIASPPISGTPAWTPQWTDSQALNCVIAALAARPPDCDLQEIYDEINYASTPVT